MNDLNHYLLRLETYTYEDIENDFKEMLDDCYPQIEFAGMVINASDMETLDPTMFRCGVADYSSEHYEEHEGLYYDLGSFEEAKEEFEAQEEEE